MKKSISIIISIFFIILLVYVPTYAEGALSIETTKVYSGMNRSYSNGYTPQITDGVVSVVLPLQGNTLNDVICVTPDMGIDGPFVYSNYQFNVRKSDGIYLINLPLRLKSERTGGLYPVIFNVSYDTQDGAMQQSFTVYVNVPDGNKTGEPELFITDYKVSPIQEEENEETATKTVINGGDEFNVSVTIKNVGSGTAKKIRLTYETVDGSIIPESSLNTVRIDDMSAGKSRTITFKMSASINVLAGEQPFNISITYASDTMNYDISKQLTVKVTQPVKITIDNLMIPEIVETSQSFTIPISILNEGKSNIYDVTCRLDMDGMFGSSVYIGQVDAGTTGFVEMKVFAGTLSSNNKYGSTSGNLIITYKDSDSNEYTESISAATTITEPEVIPADLPAEENQRMNVPTVSQWYISVIIGISVIAIAVAVIIVASYQRKLKMK